MFRLFESILLYLDVIHSFVEIQRLKKKIVLADVTRKINNKYLFALWPNDSE